MGVIAGAVSSFQKLNLITASTADSIIAFFGSYMPEGSLDSILLEENEQTERKKNMSIFNSSSTYHYFKKRYTKADKLVVLKLALEILLETEEQILLLVLIKSILMKNL